MTRHLLWIDLEKGCIALENKINGEHESYEYIQIEVPGKTGTAWPLLAKEGCPREFHKS